MSQGHVDVVRTKPQASIGIGANRPPALPRSCRGIGRRATSERVREDRG
jgi:hypothetical protein